MQNPVEGAHPLGIRFLHPEALWKVDPLKALWKACHGHVPGVGYLCLSWKFLMQVIISQALIRKPVGYCLTILSWLNVTFKVMSLTFTWASSRENSLK